MAGSEFNLAYLQKHGLSIPLLFRDKSGLGLRVPSTNFTVNDVRTCVGMFDLIKHILFNIQIIQKYSLLTFVRLKKDIGCNGC